MNDSAENPASSADLPLHGVRVLDLTLARAGPTCVRHLADWGADVVRIEPPSNGNEDIVGARHLPDFQNLHRNKRGIELNLKSEEGRAAFYKLLETADVVVENMRAPVKDKLKIGWDDVHAANPRVVYASLSGFGQDGPYRSRPGVDQIIQGMSGLMSVTGIPGQGPVRAGIAVADLTAGNMLALGIAMALFQRERTGVGRWVTTSLIESQIFMLDFQAARWLIGGEVARQVGNEHPTGVPSGVYPTKDGYMNLAAVSTRIFNRFCEAIGHPEWATRPEWNHQLGRRGDRARLNAAVTEVLKKKTTREWAEILHKAEVPSGPIYTIDQVFDDPQVKHLPMTVPVNNPKIGERTLVASPLNFSGSRKRIRRPAPDAGEHTTAVLEEVGLSPKEIEAVYRANAAAQPAKESE